MSGYTPDTCKYRDRHGQRGGLRGYCPVCKWRKKFLVKFAWYDLWVGVFYDRRQRTIYICPLPTLLIEWRLPQERTPWA